MVNFDSPNRETCTVRETRTNTPLQALNLMNDEAFLEASRRLAERAIRDGGPRPDQRIDYLYRVVLARNVKPAEKQIMLATLDSFSRRYQNDEKSAADLVAYGKSSRNPAIQVSELAAYTTVASLMLNLDETITKE
jgi:hypothetical protein